MKDRLLFLLIVAYVLVSNLAGRELGYLPLLGRLKYLHLFLVLIVPLLRFGRMRRIPYARPLLLFFLLTSIAPLQSFLSGESLATHYNFALLTIFYVAAFQVFDREKRLRVLMGVVVVSWLLSVVYKEVLFQGEGVSLLFSLENLRKVGGIRQSSDTVSSVGMIVALYYFSKWSVSKRRLLRREMLVTGLAVYVVLRYRVRAAYAASILLFVTHYFTKPSGLIAKKLRLALGGVLLAVAVMLPLAFLVSHDGDLDAVAFSTIDAVRSAVGVGGAEDAQALDSKLTMVYRAATWLDNLRYSLTDGFAWVHLSKDAPRMDHSYSESFGIEAYENPHNSYLLLLQNYGMLPLLLFLVVIGGLLRTVSKPPAGDRWLLFIFLTLLAYAFLAFFTPIFEVPYQGGVFWVFAGAGMRRASSPSHRHGSGGVAGASQRQ